MGEFNLAILIREQPGLGPLKDTQLSALETSSVLASRDAAAASLDSGHEDRLVVQKSIEEADGIAATAYAGDKSVG